MRFITQVLIVLVLFTTMSFGRIIRVPGNAANIQGGINVADRDDGDTILVAAGFYPERINFGGKKIVLTSRFIYSRSWETVEETIIDAVWDTTVVRFSGAETNETILMGFTIRHGRSTIGAGINIAGADPTISHCLITENLARSSGRGGGIYCGDGSPILDNLRIVGNQSEGNGSGLYCDDTEITIINTTFASNNTDNQGGALYFTGSSTADISRSLIIGNGANYGGAMLVAGSHRDGINLDRVTIYGNGSDHEDSGAMDIRDGYVNIVNCIIRNNGDNSLAASSGHPDDLIVSYCNIEDGEDGIDINDRYYDWGEGNIDENPRFVDPRGDDYHLLENSPCIDAGDPDSPSDPDGSRADMGRYYFHQSGLAWGYVLNVEEDSPVIGSVRMFNDLFERFANTNENGMWVIEGATIGDFSLTAFALGFNDSTLTGLHLEANEELQVDTIRLLHPTFEPSVDQLYLHLDPDSSGELGFTIANNGNGPLEWSVRKRITGNMGVDPWTLRDTFFVGERLDEMRIQGVVLADDHYYVSGGYTSDSSMIYILNMEGDSVGAFRQHGTSRYGFYDLAYDGETIWGVESNDVYAFTPDGDSVTTFEGPGSLRGIAWDPDREVLWLAHQRRNPIEGYDRAGNPILAVDRFGFEIFGLAYYPDDPDGYPLYVFHKNEDDQQTIHKIRPEEDNEDTIFVAILHPPNGGRPEGAFISSEYDDLGSWVFINIANAGSNDGGDRVDVWQLASYSGWMLLDPVGDLDDLRPGTEQDFTLSLTSLGPGGGFSLPIGNYQGELFFEHNAIEGQMRIPVTMNIDSADAVDEGWTAVPTELAIAGIYPNPFNSMTTIAYNLPTAGLVTIGLYDIQGRLVTLLEDGLLAAGRHQTTVTADDLPSGLYFVRLEALQSVKTQKVVLMR